MHMNRREFLQLLAVAVASGMALDSKSALAGKAPANFYEVPRHGNVSLLHFTDCHAQLLPIVAFGLTVYSMPPTRTMSPPCW